ASTIEYRVRVMMAQYDRDKNGYLDSKEVAEAFEFDAYSLAALDLDGDGKVVPNELEAALQRESTVTRSLIQIEFHRRGPSLWNLLDTNVDQILSERELRKLGELLRNFDIDGDGVIAYHECPFGFEVQINRGVRSDRSSRRQYLQPSRAKLGNSPPTWFLRMDANGDSDISLREFLGTAEQFQRLDTDRDGLIDAREAEKATQ
ncbi:MAG TPA: hypothetical protein VHB77_16820, partial [Planctomycetaceae bacterium]|nr:hypothetical protein [Planctomycetaceae bacterium]